MEFDLPLSILFGLPGDHCPNRSIVGIGSKRDRATGFDDEFEGVLRGMYLPDTGLG